MATQLKKYKYPPKDTEGAVKELVSFAEDTARLLTNGLTVRDNLSAEIRTLTAVYGEFPLDIKTTKSRPRFVFLSKIRDLSTPSDSYSTGNMFVWKHVKDGIRVSSVEGLNASRKYEFEFLLLGE